MNKFQKLMAMIRFSHTVFALPFALLGAVMAWAIPVATAQAVEFNWFHLAGILVCMVGARSAAMAFNRLSDRTIDGNNPRTANRHIPSGELSVGLVSAFCFGSSALFVAGTLFFLPNWIPIVLSLPILGWLFAYSYTKRFTSLAHFWLGISLALAPVCAWIAIRGMYVIENPIDILPSVYLGLAILFWVAGFDIIYACQDYQFDKQSKLFSVPSLIGVPYALRTAAICHAVMIAFLVLLGMSVSNDATQGLGWLYWVSISLVALLLTYEHLLVRPNDLSKVNIAFFNINAIVSIGLFVTVSLDLLVL